LQKTTFLFIYLQIRTTKQTIFKNTVFQGKVLIPRNYVLT